MNDHDEAALFADDWANYDIIKEFKRPDGRYSFTHPAQEVTLEIIKNRPGAEKLPGTSLGPVPTDFGKGRRVRLSPEVEEQFTEYKRFFDPEFNPNEYTYSSGEHRPYGRIERNY